MIVIAPFMVQGRTVPSLTLESMLNESSLRYEAIADQKLADETVAVANIRLTRPDANRTLTIHEDGFDDSELEPTRQVAWNISKALLGSDSTLYFLRDQKQYDPATYTYIHHGTIDGARLFVRSEEGLLHRAHQLIEQVLESVANDTEGKLSLCPDDHGDCVIRMNKDGDVSHLPLRGYEFNPRDTGSERVYFEHYPSCEVFLAASALEQVELLEGEGGVIRICHYGLRNRDTAAKNLLQAAGYTDLPIETVAVGDDGKPNKIFSWHNDNERKKAMRTMIRDAVVVQNLSQ